MVVEQPEDSWYGYSGAVFTLGQLAGMRLAVAQWDGLMVGIERERHGNLGTAGPRMRFQASAGANPLDISAPARLIPGPRLIFMRHVNTSS
jgi:hypothetical protein